MHTYTYIVVCLVKFCGNFVMECGRIYDVQFQYLSFWNPPGCLIFSGLSHMGGTGGNRSRNYQCISTLKLSSLPLEIRQPCCVFQDICQQYFKI